MAAPSNEVNRSTRSRALVGGFGLPGLRDLDFGRNFVSYSQHLDWPEDVVVEEVPSSALLVLHRLQELRPKKLVIVTAASRWPDQPGTVRRYQLVDGPAAVLDDHQSDALVSGGDLDHSLALARQWGALPETVVIEVEPAETTLGLGFSEEVGASLDHILALVAEELGVDPDAREAGEGPSQALRVPHGPGPEQNQHDRGCRADLGTVVARRRSSVRFDQLPHVADLVLSVRLHPGDPGRRKGYDWCDVIPLPDGWTEVLIGEVAGQGLDAATAVSELRTAARVTSSAVGQHPAQVLAGLDHVVRGTDLTKMATALCLAVHPRTGRVRVANAGQCPPVLRIGDAPPELCEQGSSGPLGALAKGWRPEASLCLPRRWSLLLATSGLVSRPRRGIGACMADLALVAGSGPPDLEGLCDHVFTAAQRDLTPGEGGCLLGLHRAA